jgi:hypothetical protein
MRFDETIRLRALQLKALHSGQTNSDLLEAQLQLPEVSENLKLRQVCAMVSPQLFTELEGTCELLGMSKRKFVEGALIDAIEKASAIVNEVDPFTSGTEAR